MLDQQPISLQNRLVKSSMLSSMLAGVVALILLLVISLYQNMQTHDNMMDEIADLILVSDISSHVGNELDDLSEQFDIKYELKLDELILIESQDLAFNQIGSKVFFQNDHFGFVWLEGRLFRYYSEQSDQQILTMLQPMSARVDQLFKSLLGYGGVLIILWGIQWFILHFIIRRQFRSIHQLSKLISQKTVKDLSPITPSKPELKELQPIVSQINQMMERLDRAITAEQRFTADASHELRSPLSAIQMRLQLLKRKYQSDHEGLSQDLEQILKDVSRGSNILENLLLLARLDPSSKQDVPIQSIDLDRLTKEVLHSVQPLSQEKNIQFKTELGNHAIKANPELMFSCIRNLVENAIRYTPPNGIVDISIKKNNNEILFVIENEGHGIEQTVIDRLGERFYRQLGTRTTGSGLGLSICRKIVELHQAEIVFKKSELGGLKVEIKFH
ncbi:HAMP domain-containing sensor histidine kinase [Acinetobacter sp. Ver3]|uniref:sensor histidine kinase n=1 Tax=Acinetobacter sp. Ver3 TaxID=466088 RepID=UPI000AC07A02|nr:HAMP domain-containing sensor histidine kinase [Acinetobacter sp. Ver3]